MKNRQIQIDRVSITFETPNQEVYALKETSLCIDPLKTTVIMGESGCGKSVLLLNVLGMLPYYALVKGNVYFGEENLSIENWKKRRERLGREIAYIPQDPFSSLNALRKIKPQMFESIWDKKDRMSRVVQMMERFGFESPHEVLKKYPFELSGGMLQRILFILAIMNNPKWLFADEPTKGLDPDLLMMTLELLRQVKNERECSILLITHDPILARELGDEIIMMYAGEVIEQSDELFERPLHPYSQALLEASPERGFHPIIGRSPDLSIQTKGCAYYNRCLFCMERCQEKRPEFFEIEGKKVRCYLYD